MTAAEIAGNGSEDDGELRREGARIAQLIEDLATIAGAPEAARDFDPGPDPAARPAGALVQIDLGRSRAAKGGGTP